MVEGKEPEIERETHRQTDRGGRERGTDKEIQTEACLTNNGHHLCDIGRAEDNYLKTDEENFEQIFSGSSSGSSTSRCMSSSSS